MCNILATDYLESLDNMSFRVLNDTSLPKEHAITCSSRKIQQEQEQEQVLKEVKPLIYPNKTSQNVLGIPLDKNTLK